MKINGDSECCVSGVINPLSVSSNGTYNPPIGVDGYAPVKVNVPQGYTLDQIIDGDIQISTISSTCVEFNTAGCWKAVKSVNLPSCMWIAEWAFYNGAIEYISAPVCAGVGDGFCCLCPSLQEVYLPAVEAVPIQCFYGCEALSSVTITACETVGFGAFVECTALSQISLPNCISISQQAFQGCSSLSQISLPICSYIGKQAFYGTGLQTLDLPMLLRINDTQTFANCSSLSQVHLSLCSYIANYAFANCANGMSLYLNSPIPCSLGGPVSTVFNNMSDVKVYVRPSLIDTYKTYNYWSDFSANIFPIE